MQTEYGHFPVTPIALKMGVAIGIGMLAGMEREWSNKDVGIRTFAIVALLGMLASLIGQNVAVAALIGVFLLVTAMNARSILTNHSLEITTSAALMVIYLLGLLVGLGHIFTPVAGAIVMSHATRLENGTDSLCWGFAAIGDSQRRTARLNRIRHLSGSPKPLP